MLERKAYIFKLKPDGAQKRKLAWNAGCCRFAYNKALDWNEELYKVDKSHKVSVNIAGNGTWFR